MKISTRSIRLAVEAKILTAKQADKLLIFLKTQADSEPNFNLTNVLYYFGGLIAIGAMSLFMTLGWESFGGAGIFFLSILYGILGLALATQFQRKSYPVPAGICATFVVALTPLAIYGLQVYMGWWPDSTPYRSYNMFIKWHWLFMELGTLIVGCILAWIYAYPFMIMPIAVTLWYLSMDLAAMLAGGGYIDFALRAMVSMYFGLVIVLLALWVDLRTKGSADYAFWLYLFGVLAFWSGMTMQSSDSELSKFFYLCINLIMIGVGVVLMRRVFVIFGGLGCSVYLGHLAWQVFEESLWFPMALTFIGLLIIYLGTLWQKNEAWITEKAQSVLPTPLQKVLHDRHDA